MGVILADWLESCEQEDERLVRTGTELSPGLQDRSVCGPGGAGFTKFTVRNMSDTWNQLLLLCPVHRLPVHQAGSSLLYLNVPTCCLQLSVTCCPCLCRSWGSGWLCVTGTRRTRGRTPVRSYSVFQYDISDTLEHIPSRTPRGHTYHKRTEDEHTRRT